MPELIESRNLFISTKDTTIFAKIHTEVTSVNTIMQIKDISPPSTSLVGFGVSGEGIAKDTIVTVVTDQNTVPVTVIVTLSKPTTKIISVDTPIAFNSMNNFTFDLSNKKIRNPSGIIKYSKLTLIDFNMYRNFYLINKFNNTVYANWTGNNVTSNFKFEIAEGDYTSIVDIASAFQTALINFLPTVTATATASGKTFVQDVATEPPTAGSRTGILKCSLKTQDGTSHGITALVLQTRNYVDDDNIDELSFGSSYAILGGKRITGADANSQSFTIDLNLISGSDTGKITVTGHYPMQRHTTPYVYLRCVEPATTNNIESTSVTAGPSDSDILAKIPVQNELISYVSNANSPYFIKTRQNESDITSLQFKLTDENNRELPHIDAEQTSKGNASCEMTINHSIYL